MTSSASRGLSTFSPSSVTVVGSPRRANEPAAPTASSTASPGMNLRTAARTNRYRGSRRQSPSFREAHSRAARAIPIRVLPVPPGNLSPRRGRRS